jgi:hypothetical protein
LNTDRGLGQIQARSGARHVTFAEQHVERDQEIEIESIEIVHGYT